MAWSRLLALDVLVQIGVDDFADSGGRAQNSNAFGGGGGGGGRRKGGRGGQGDSRFDPRYQYDSEGLNAKGLPIPNFAPLPSYAGGDDMTSDAGSVYGGSQYGGSQWGGSQSRYGGMYGGGSVNGDYYDLRSQADGASVTGSIDSRRF